MPGEDVLQHAEPPYAGQPLADLLTELPVDRVHRVFAELDVAAERPLKRAVGRLGHQQCPVSRSPDHGHRLDDLSPGVHRTVLSRR
jgi:hypothetical protein